MRDGRKLLIAALGLALAASGAACGGTGGRATGGETAGDGLTASAAAAPPPAAATPIAKASSPSAALTGGAQGQPILSVLSVEHQVDVLTEREGVVMAINAEEDSPVRQGENLAQLDDRTQRAQLAHEQADLVVAQDNVKYNESELKAKQANYKRYQELREYGLSSDADLEKARFEAEGAQDDLDSWKAIVKRTETQIRMAELEIGKMQIRAPFAGVVARRYIRQGQTLVKGDRCFRITQLRPLRVRFPVPETFSGAPRAGERVLVSLADNHARSFSARIVRVSPVIDPASGSWDVLAELTDPPGDLRPGMAVEVHWPPAGAAATRH